MGAPVVHFEIISKDAPAVREFYRAAFGWPIGQSVPGAGGVDYEIVHPNDGGVGIDGGIGEAPAGYDGHVTFYLGVPDVAQALENVERYGGKKMMGPEQVPGGPVIGLFKDPRGHTIGLVETPA